MTLTILNHISLYAVTALLHNGKLTSTLQPETCRVSTFIHLTPAPGQRGLGHWNVKLLESLTTRLVYVITFFTPQVLWTSMLWMFGYEPKNICLIIHYDQFYYNFSSFKKMYCRNFFLLQISFSSALFYCCIIIQLLCMSGC